MTREQATEVLGVHAAATVDEVRSRFEALYSDFQIRLSNAPTPNLKRLFQERLNELRQAAETFHPGVTTKHDDLPSPVPVYVVAPLPDKKPALPTPSGPASHDDAPLPPRPKLVRPVFLVGLFAALVSALIYLAAQQWIMLTR